jgi:hypothetical protein
MLLPPLLLLHGILCAEAREVTLASHRLRHHELTHLTVLDGATGESRPLQHHEHHTRLPHAPGEPRLHARSARYSFRALGRTFDMELERNEDLLGKGFVSASTSATRNKTAVSRLGDVEHCYYHGRLVGEPTSEVAVHTCGEGIESSIRTETGEHIVTMPASRVVETRAGAAAGRHALGELPQHVVFRTSDHLLWREDGRDCERGETWKEEHPRSLDQARNISTTVPVEGFAPTGGCTCKGAFGFEAVWYAAGGCQRIGDAEPFCFTEDECGHGGGNAWTPCLDSAGHEAAASSRRRMQTEATVPITNHVELTIVNDYSQFEVHEASSTVELRDVDLDADRGARTREGVDGETRTALELTVERSMQLANAVNVAYRSMNRGIGVTLVAVRTYEDEASEIADNLHANAVSESISDYLGKVSDWRQTVQPTLLDGVIDLSSDNTALITAKDQLSTANDAGSSGVAGLAWIGTMCNARMSSSVNEDAPGSTWQWAAETITHEMGHNFGSGHDGSADASHCSESGNVMAAVGCGNCPRNAGTTAVHGDVGGLVSWSPCSDTFVTDTLQNLGGTPSNCLANDPREAVGGDFCGDRIVTGDEACDDGPAGSSLCSAECQLMPGVACASGSCCDSTTGEFRVGGELCRDAMHQCDLPDYCSGTSADCGADIFKADGTECTEGGVGARCSGGSCKGLDAQCSAAFNGFQGTWVGQSVSSLMVAARSSSAGKRNGHQMPCAWR